MGITATVVVLVLVLVGSVAGGGASAEFEAVHHFHEDGHDAALSYTFVLEDLPESPDGLVVRLESAAFASPVVIPWNIVSDQPAAEATLYTNQTSIDSVLIDEVVSQDAVVRISVELDGHSVGSERLDIRELYSFD
jgi:hypothetical protein